MNTQAISFIDIFQGENTLVKSIEIPIIQRDYAQGRETKEVTRIRRQFLDVLYDALTGKSEAVQLDFVYGNITDGKLIPLDGQQRLTTLFLLHWYIAKLEGVKEAQYSFLKDFTYRTRFSSRYFCESLLTSSPDFTCDKLSNWITNQDWFMYTWDKDPTINSMLVMLNDIHSMFKDEKGLWEKLNKKNEPLISFYFLPLEDMGLTDNLYIKMNSRGKPLTEFEHFKAEFGKIIKSVSEDLYKEFAQKVDIEWVDMLWKYRGEDDITDDEFMRYYRFVTEILCYLYNYNIFENDFDLANIVYGNQNNDAKSNLSFLFKAFDCWKDLENIDDFFNETFSNYHYEPFKVNIFSDDTNLFKQCCDNYSSLIIDERRRFTLTNTLLLYAVLQYLINRDKINGQQFTERIRIIRNLVMNSPDEIRKDRLQILLLDVKNIIVDGIINIGNLGFNEIQKKEENEKLLWRQTHTDLIEDINQLEEHQLLQGSTAIIGLEEPEKFRKRAENFRLLFIPDIHYHSISKALLTIDDYSQLASWRFLFGNDYHSTWRELFTISKQRKNFEKTRSAIIQLLDDIKPEFNDYLTKKVDDYFSNDKIVIDWRYYFIKYPQMRKGSSGVYWWKNDPTREKLNQYEIIMMNTSLSLNGKHWDPFLYVLFTDVDFKDKLTLEEYGAPLIINTTNQRIRCKNSCWEIYDSNDLLINSIDIPQDNGNDVIDRIEYFKRQIHIV